MELIYIAFHGRSRIGQGVGILGLFYSEKDLKHNTYRLSLLRLTRVLKK